MADADSRPLIAVTGPSRGGAAPRFCVHLAIWLAGGRATQLTPASPEPSGRYHGVVVSGGHDVDPVLYAAESEVHPRYDRERDAFESAIIDDALDRDLPLLGICRGAQLLNVRLGGTLFQELRSRRHHTGNRWTVLPIKTLQLEPGSALRALLGDVSRSRINTLHNQGIDQLGRNLTVSGRDLDGIVQAVESAHHGFLLGVQWHPEFLVYMQRQRRIFRALVQAARLRRERGHQ